MEIRLTIMLATLLIAMLYRVEAQGSHRSQNNASADPRSLQQLLVIGDDQRNRFIASLLAVQHAMPMGPQDVLRDYEKSMNLISNRLSMEMASISQAVVENKITREQAEFAIQERYEVALMQHEVLTALHDSLEHDVYQTTTRNHDPLGQSNAVAVQPPLAPQIQAQ